MKEELDLKHPKLDSRREVTPESVGATPKKTEDLLHRVPSAVEGILRTNTARVRAKEALNDRSSPSGGNPESSPDITDAQPDLFGRVVQQHTEHDNADTTTKGPTGDASPPTSGESPQLNLNFDEDE